MTAYDVAAWADFANTVAGGAAALAGLLFVGLSLNLADFLKYPGVPRPRRCHARADHRDTADRDLRRHARTGPLRAGGGDRCRRDLRGGRGVGVRAVPA